MQQLKLIGIESARAVGFFSARHAGSIFLSVPPSQHGFCDPPRAQKEPFGKTRLLKEFADSTLPKPKCSGIGLAVATQSSEFP
ncbi:hypothetical protein HUU39_14795 [candidate division KSB1 bacterium]|nr:hypothetical protein [bacterium]NUM66510.1 hypothetical protein [candidate division KSB1 bacterium]